MIELSVVIPVYKSEKTIGLLVEKLQTELKDIAFEVILVNDGSPDNSEKVCIDLVNRFEHVKLVSLRKNFGEFNAVMAGLNNMEGEYAVMIDDDFQNPPSEILKLVETARNGGFDVVYSQYADKKHSFFRNLGSWTINKINNFLLEKPKDLYLSSFKLIKKEVVQEIIQYKGAKPYIDALIFRVTNNVGKVFVEHNDRAEGQSSYTFKKLISLFLSIIFEYSIFPIRFIFLLNLLVCLLIIALFFCFNLLIINNLYIFLLFLSQTVFLGILVEYIGRKFLNESGKPQFVIKKIVKNN